MLDDDTRPLRPAMRLQMLKAPYFEFTSPAKSLWVNDRGNVTVNLIAEKDADPIPVNIFGPGCIPIRVKKVLSEGTTAKQIIAMRD